MDARWHIMIQSETILKNIVFPIRLSTHAHDSINQSMCGVMGPFGPIGAHLGLLVPGPRRERVRKNGVWGIAT